MSQQGGDVSLAHDSPVEQVVSSVINQLQQQHQQQQQQQHSHEAGSSQQSNNSAEDDQVMVATERDLAEDAQWKRIQQNTFTRWANEHLKTVDKYIGSLETDLSDGLKLIALIEVLSGKKLPKHTKKPTFRSQKLENVSVALKFLEHDEGIRIVNIGKSSFLPYSSLFFYPVFIYFSLSIFNSARFLTRPRVVSSRSTLGPTLVFIESCVFVCALRLCFIFPSRQIGFLRLAQVRL